VAVKLMGVEPKFLKFLKNPFFCLLTVKFGFKTAKLKYKVRVDILV